MEKNIAVIKGDGIGPEIVTEAMKVLDAVAKKYNHKFNYTEILMGGCSIDAYGVPLSDEALKIAKKSDSVLLGAIGGNTTTSPWYKLEPSLSCVNLQVVFISVNVLLKKKEIKWLLMIQ